MAIRNAQVQSFHDKVIEIAANYIDKNKFDVYTNPNGYKRTGIGQSYPDIILTNKGVNSVVFTIEVKTDDSVNANEASAQWVEYSKLGGTFYLLVPKESVAKTKQLCQEYGIRAKFAEYWVVNGQLQVKYYD